MLSHAVVRKPAPMLALRPIGLRLRHGVDALGSAIGESIASGPGQKPKLTFEQDTAARQTALDPLMLRGHKSSDGFESKQRFSAVDTYTPEDMQMDRLLMGDRMAALAAPQASQTSTNASALPFSYLATDGTEHASPRPAVTIEGQRSTSLPDLDHSGYFAPGFVTSSYQHAVQMLSNPNSSGSERFVGFLAGTAMAPLMLAEEAGRALLNVPYHARQVGQYAAQFKLARTTEERVLAGLNIVSNGASAFVGTAPVIPSSVSLRPVMTAQDMAVAQFPGAEATAAARATYGNATGIVESVAPTLEQRGLSKLALPRTPELGLTSTTSELLQTSAIPGREGVVLTQRHVSFADLWQLSDNSGVEFALTRENGQFILRSGSPTSAPIPGGVRPIAHTHPFDADGLNSLLPSRADINVLNDYWARNPTIQRPVSQIITGPNQTTTFRATGLDPWGTK